MNQETKNLIIMRSVWISTALLSAIVIGGIVKDFFTL